MKRGVEGYGVAADCRDFHQLAQGAVLPAEPAARTVTWTTKNRPPNDIGIVVGVHINEHDLADLDTGITNKRKARGALRPIGGEVSRRSRSHVCGLNIHDGVIRIRITVRLD